MTKKTRVLLCSPSIFPANVLKKNIIIYRCHTSSGKCDCPAGWTGIYCDTPCPIGTYGQDCQEKCTCENGATCNHVTGKFEYLVLLLYVIYFFNGFFANCNKSSIIV